MSDDEKYIRLVLQKVANNGTYTDSDIKELLSLINSAVIDIQETIKEALGLTTT